LKLHAYTSLPKLIVNRLAFIFYFIARIIFHVKVITAVKKFQAYTKRYHNQCRTHAGVEIITRQRQMRVEFGIGE
jgi:hypothetical protein